MDAPLVECVPNVSEGRDSARIARLVEAVATTPGVTLLHEHAGPGAHRSVLTFVGDPEPLLEASFRLARACVAEIDLRVHRGAHPRMGALDVCPFVPLRGTAMETCVGLARTLGARVAAELAVPVILYGAAASAPGRADSVARAARRVREPRDETRATGVDARLRPTGAPPVRGRVRDRCPRDPRRVQRHTREPRRRARSGNRPARPRVERRARRREGDRLDDRRVRPRAGVDEPHRSRHDAAARRVRPRRSARGIGRGRGLRLGGDRAAPALPLCCARGWRDGPPATAATRPTTRRS